MLALSYSRAWRALLALPLSDALYHRALRAFPTAVLPHVVRPLQPNPIPNPDPNPDPTPDPSSNPNPNPNPTPNPDQVAQYELGEEQLLRHGRFLYYLERSSIEVGPV